MKVLITSNDCIVIKIFEEETLCCLWGPICIAKRNIQLHKIQAVRISSTQYLRPESLTVRRWFWHSSFARRLSHGRVIWSRPCRRNVFELADIVLELCGEFPEFLSQVFDALRRSLEPVLSQSLDGSGDFRKVWEYGDEVRFYRRVA